MTDLLNFCSLLFSWVINDLNLNWGHFPKEAQMSKGKGGKGGGHPSSGGGTGGGSSGGHGGGRGGSGGQSGGKGGSSGGGTGTRGK